MRVFFEGSVSGFVQRFCVRVFFEGSVSGFSSKVLCVVAAKRLCEGAPTLVLRHPCFTREARLSGRVLREGLSAGFA